MTEYGKPDDHEVREELTNNVSENFLVEAAAGTGKTTALVKRAVQLIKTGHVEDVRRMACITFTHKAAGELKYRIREELQELLEEVTGDVRDRVRRALDHIDDAPISTIHAFASDLLKRYPAEAGVDPNFEILEEQEETSIEDSPVSEILDNWLREIQSDPPEHWLTFHERAGSFKTDAVREAIKNLREDSFRQKVKRICGRIIQSKHKLKERFAGKIQAFVDEAKENYLNQTLDREDLLAEGVVHLKETCETHFDHQEERLEETFFSQKTDPFGARGSSGLADNWDDSERINARFKELEKEWEKLREIYLFRCLKDCIRKARETKIRMLSEGMLTFDDLLGKSVELVRNPEIREEVKHEYDVFLIDETQDTDPRQIELFVLLAEELDSDSATTDWREVTLGPGRLFLVGDPKQSIYGWRNADITAYEQYSSALFDNGSSGNLRRLRVNFRSYMEHLDWVNRIFDGVEPDSEPDQPSGTEAGRTGIISSSHEKNSQLQPEYVPLTERHDIQKWYDAREEKEVSQPPGPYVISPLEDVDGTETVDDQVGDQKVERNSLATARMIKHITGNPDWQVHEEQDDESVICREIQFGDIGLILPTYTDITQLEEALLAEEIPFHYAGGETFFLTQEVRELANVASAIADPTSTRHVVGALQSSFFGHDLEQITRDIMKYQEGEYEYEKDESIFEKRRAASTSAKLARSYELLDDLHQRACTETPSSVLRQLYDATQVMAFQRTRPNGQRRVHNLKKIRRMAEKYGQQDGMEFHSFASWMREHVESPEAMEQHWRDFEEETEAVLSDVSERSVSIMSIYKAKGLEFPVVFLPNSYKNNFRSYRRCSPVLTSKDEEENNLELRFGKNAVGTANYKSFANETKIKERQEEEKRLDYVAVTRASNYLFMPLYQELEQEDDPGDQDGIAGRIMSNSNAGDENRDRETLANLFSIEPDRVLSPSDEELNFADDIDPDRLDRMSYSAPDVTVDKNEDLQNISDNVEALESVREAGTKSLHIRGSQPSSSKDDFHSLFLPDERWNERWKPLFEEHLENTSGGNLSIIPDELTGYERGDLLHNVLEEIDLVSPSDEEMKRALERHGGEGLQLNDEQTDRAIEIILDLLDSPPIQNADDGAQFHREFSALARLEQLDVPGSVPDHLDPGTILEGVIDLVIEPEENELHLVDYKTNDLAEPLETNDQQKHATQMEAYRALAETALDRPVSMLTLFYLDGPVAVTRDL